MNQGHFGIYELIEKWIDDPKRFVLFWSLFVLAVSSIPLVYGYLQTHPTCPACHFMGYTSNETDMNQYLAWMEQIRRGHWLIKNPYTPETHERIFFHPLFLLLGKTAAISGLPNIIIFQICRLLSGFALLLVSYKFICYFLKKDGERLLCFVIISVSGGLSWLIWFVPSLGVKGAHLYSTTFRIDSSTFWSLYLNPLASLSILLLLLCFLNFQKFIETSSYRNAFLAGVSLLFLVQLHPFDLLIPMCVLLLQITFLMLRHRSLNWNWIIGYLIMVSVASPYLFYLNFVLMGDPVFKAWSQVIIYPFSLVGFFSLYGFLFLFSLFAIPGLIKQLSYKSSFLFSWFILIPILTQLPIEPPNIPTRLIEGYHVLLSILTAMGFLKLISLLRIRIYFQAFILIVVLFSLSLGNAWVLFRDVRVLKHPYVDYFLPEAVKHGMDWLKDNTKVDDLVLASETMGLMIPAMAGNRVFLGHGFQTVNFPKKEAQLLRFFSQKSSEFERIQFLETWRIRYIFYSPMERGLGAYSPDRSTFLIPVFQNHMIRIFRVKESNTF